MGRSTSSAGVESKGIERITDEERHGRPRSQFTLWFTANVQFAMLAAGALVTSVFRLSFWESALAISVGTIVGSLMLATVAAVGPRLGVSQLVQSRAAFGYFGNFVIAALTFLNGCGWFAVSTVLGVFAFRALAPGVPFTVALSVAQVVVAVVGYKLIHLVGRIMSVALTLLFLFARPSK
ncbi:cytosine permease [Streptomyces sp. NPDC001698]|uniref:cytosine permease n=1 Tax=unclassified Streptomyces TaxID=2593676 RepID=UPI003686ABDF